jgi:hypothetical protein
MAQPTSASRGGTLNIVFHGTCAYLLDGSIRAIIPDVANYTIVAGTFLNEQPLKKGARYHLKGVKVPSGPTARISTDANLFLLGASLKADAAIFCELHLPPPANFRSVRCMNVDQKWFPSPPTSFKFSSQLALVHVLSYDFDDPTELVILDKANNRFPWEPKFNHQTKTVNLHFYSDPQTNAPQALPAFTTLTDLFGQTVPLDTSAIGLFVSPPNVYPEIRGLEEPMELQDYNSSRPQGKAEQAPYNCTKVVGIVQGTAQAPAKTNLAIAATGSASLGFSVSVKGEVHGGGAAATSS